MTEKEKDKETLEDISFDAIDILQIFWKHKAVIIVLSILAAAIMFSKTAFFTENQYTSYGILHVSNKSDEQETVDSIQKSDLDTSKSLSTTYMEILKTRIFLKEVSVAVDGKYTGKEIGEALSISTINDTELLKIEVTTCDPDDSYWIAKTIVEKAPQKLISVYKSGEVEIVDPPVYSKEPDGKGYFKYTLIGFVVGFVLGCGYAFVCDMLDNKIHKGEDVSKRFGVSVLGETAQSVQRSSGKKKKGKKKNNADELENIINPKTDFDTVETYKAIRTNIMFSLPKKELGKVIAVTSASPGEGKTTTAVNLSITFAQTGAKIMLIDCDLRRARVHRYLQLERKDGVSNILCGFSELERAIHRNVRENLDCITAGEVPPNPAELLQTEEFRNMVAELQKEYDYIFIDTPPITVVTDAAIIAKQSAGVVVVASGEMTTYDLFGSAVGELRNTGAQIIGTIVHNSGEKQKKYGYYKSGKYGGKYAYKYKYAYRYGDDEKNGRI